LQRQIDNPLSASSQLSARSSPLPTKGFSIVSRKHPNRRPEGRGHADEPAGIDIVGLTKRYLTPKGETFTAIKDVTLAVEPGQFCSIVGPTGCGKSTTLAQVSGLERPSAGSVRVGGALVNGITEGVSYMFQADALFPWKSVLHNVMMGPLLLGTPKREAAELATDWIRRVGLAGFEDRYPHQLSGGMRKRVAMAAALINNPRILLMDEPFGALDAQTKVIMQNELLKLWEELRPSVLFITHDLDEAVALSDRVVIMTSSPGAVKDVFDVDLPRPRGNVQEIRHEQRFLDLQGRIWESLKDEVTRAYARSAGAAA
jgi:sulfonate transport system ATP-binding protein